MGSQRLSRFPKPWPCAESMIGGARPATVFWRFRNRGRIMFEQAKAADVSGRCWAYLMTKMLTLALAGSAVASVAKTALCAPSLQATALYKDTAHGCRALDMKSWSHPTRKVLERSKSRSKRLSCATKMSIQSILSGLTLHPCLASMINISINSMLKWPLRTVCNCSPHLASA